MGVSRIRNIPSPGYFSSNHVLINRERILAGLPPLKRSVRLDDLARAHAQVMADNTTVQPSVPNIERLQEKLKAPRVGENTLRGASIRSIHQEMMTNPENPYCRGNLLAANFTEFGMGTAVGADGKLYLCQLFSGGRSRPCDNSSSSEEEEDKDEEYNSHASS